MALRSLPKFTAYDDLPVLKEVTRGIGIYQMVSIEMGSSFSKMEQDRLGLKQHPNHLQPKTPQQVQKASTSLAPTTSPDASNNSQNQAPATKS